MPKEPPAYCVMRGEDVLKISLSSVLWVSPAQIGQMIHQDGVHWIPPWTESLFLRMSIPVWLHEVIGSTDLGPQPKPKQEGATDRPGQWFQCSPLTVKMGHRTGPERRLWPASWP
eukprot:scaffold228_cov312-Pinguiococcus_pyrenoidosus.AAC.47